MTCTRYLIPIFFATLPLTAKAAPGSQPEKVAQSFYDGYIKGGGSNEFVLNSAAVTPEFKKVYKAFIKDADHDPIIAGQDYPDAGFKASAAVLKGRAARVVMKSRDPGFDNKITVQLVFKGDTWLINGVNELRGK